jgi:hypothetical protein
MNREIREKIKANGLIQTRKEILEEINKLKQLQKQNKNAYVFIELENKIIAIENTLKQLSNIK